MAAATTGQLRRQGPVARTWRQCDAEACRRPPPALAPSPQTERAFQKQLGVNIG